jgi:2-phosphoglycerate kinase
MHSPAEHVLPRWKVLLIGGGSGVGKTMLTQVLAHWFGVSVLLIDDLRLALQQMTSPAQHPGLHVFATDHAAAQRPPEAMRDGLITVAHTLTPAIKMIMAHHIAVPGVGPVIMEGDGILPEVAAARQFHELKHFSTARSNLFAAHSRVPIPCACQMVWRRE